MHTNKIIKILLMLVLYIYPHDVSADTFNVYVFRLKIGNTPICLKNIDKKYFKIRNNNNVVFDGLKNTSTPENSIFLEIKKLNKFSMIFLTVNHSKIDKDQKLSLEYDYYGLFGCIKHTIDFQNIKCDIAPIIHTEYICFDDKPIIGLLLMSLDLSSQLKLQINGTPVDSEKTLSEFGNGQFNLSKISMDNIQFSSADDHMNWIKFSANAKGNDIDSFEERDKDKIKEYLQVLYRSIDIDDYFGENGAFNFELKAAQKYYERFEKDINDKENDIKSKQDNLNKNLSQFNADELKDNFSDILRQQNELSSMKDQLVKMKNIINFASLIKQVVNQYVYSKLEAYLKAPDIQK